MVKKREYVVPLHDHARRLQKVGGASEPTTKVLRGRGAGIDKLNLNVQLLADRAGRVGTFRKRRHAKMVDADSSKQTLETEENT